MTEGFEHELELRRRLLPHVLANLNERVVEDAVDGLWQLVFDESEIAEKMLAPMFEFSEYWPHELAKGALGLPEDQEFTLEELLERFENPAQTEKPNWKKEGF